MIHLESNFVQFKEELLPKEGNKALLTFPFLHIYWTECCVSTGWGGTPAAGGARAREPVRGPVVFLDAMCSWFQAGGSVPVSASPNCGFPGESLGIAWFWPRALVAIGFNQLEVVHLVLS